MNALRDMNDLKASGIDGFNTLCFKKAWPSIGREIGVVVIHLLETGFMTHAINQTTVTLIPKSL